MLQLKQGSEGRISFTSNAGGYNNLWWHGSVYKSANTANVLLEMSIRQCRLSLCMNIGGMFGSSCTVNSEVFGMRPPERE